MPKGRDLSLAADMQLGAFRDQTPETRELSVLQETGLITAKQADELAAATRDLRTMREVSSIPRGRHFSYIDTVLSARSPSPVGQARDVLQELGTAWESARGDFQRLRKIHFEIKLKRAELAKMGGALERCDDEGDRGILEAKRDLLAVEIEDLESDLTYGMRTLQGVTEGATEAASRYEGILTTAGKEALTAEDFLDEDLGYFLKSAFYHASQVLINKSWVPDDGTGGGSQANRQYAVELAEEVILYFEGLDIARSEIIAEMQDLLAMRGNFDIANGGQGRHNRSFQDHFDNWLRRMTQKYLDRAKSAVGRYGIARLQRIASIIEPTRGDGADLAADDDLGMRQERRGSLLR